MTLHLRHSKTEVGIRELHDQLSRYVRQVADGGEVIVTMRGKPVARLTPVGDDDPLADLRARGLVQEPQGEWQPTWRDRSRPTRDIDDLVREQRR